ncbi:MAG: hypothetical protein PF692_06380 [Kiritimatiellae bacterium]|nr:hypothetical protein [Kiritimatiellia bacterium]
MTLCIILFVSSVTHADSTEKKASDLVKRYFEAVEKENISTIEKVYFFGNDQQKEEILYQFKYAFDMADTRLESVDIKKVSIDDDVGSGLVFVNVKATLTSFDGSDSLKKEKKFVVVMHLDNRKWKIRKVMPRGVYDSYLRLAVYNNTPEYLEAAKNGPAKIPPHPDSHADDEKIPLKTNITITCIKQVKKDVTVSLAGAGLTSGVVLEGELAYLKSGDIVERSMVIVSEEGVATLQFRSPFLGWKKRNYKVNIKIDGIMMAGEAIKIVN